MFNIICNLMSESQLMKNDASCVKTLKDVKIINETLKLTVNYNSCEL